MTSVVPEFSRVIPTETIGDGGQSLTIDADAGERARLAKRLGLADLEDLSAELSLTPEREGQLIRLKGTLKAAVTQTCVVTLEPLEGKIEGILDRLYDVTQEQAGNDEETFDIEAEDPPEPVQDGVIDVGEAVAEQLALELDPFPRKLGISFADFLTGPEEGDTPPDEKAKTGPGGGPFAALKKLKKKLK
jgi:uncharacterized metal-binding protein YceD (DUF177 family)